MDDSPPAKRPDVTDVTLQIYIEARLTEVERSVAREVAVLRTLMAEHASAHAREHQMSQTAIDKAYEEIQKQFFEERTFVMHHNELMQRAVDKAEVSTNIRLESMNEFRAVLTNQSAEMARREYVDQTVDNIAKRIEQGTNTFNERLDERVNGATTAGTERARATNVRLDGIEATLAHRLDELREAVQTQTNKWSNLEGRMYAISAFMGFILFLITVVGFIMREVAR